MDLDTVRYGSNDVLCSLYVLLYILFNLFMGYSSRNFLHTVDRRASRWTDKIESVLPQNGWISCSSQHPEMYKISRSSIVSGFESALPAFNLMLSVNARDIFITTRSVTHKGASATISSWIAGSLAIILNRLLERYIFSISSHSSHRSHDNSMT
jgi:hypothetical protein